MLVDKAALALLPVKFLIADEMVVVCSILLSGPGLPGRPGGCSLHHTYVTQVFGMG